MPDVHDTDVIAPPGRPHVERRMRSRDDSASAHVLVVDDNEMNRDLLARRLRREGHRVALAVDGRDALDKLAADPFDLVLLDIMMPGMDGHELLRRLKADELLRDIPVILISALNDTDNMVQGLSQGADDYLSKPFNPHILRARVNASLARKRLHDYEQRYARSLEREMDIARDIQASFLPDHLPVVAGWDMAACFLPARRVAGDFYDAFALHEGRRIGVVVADVCDKGVGAALFMALFRSLIRAFAERMRFLDDDAAEQVRQLVDHLNGYIARTHGRANMFATLFFAILDPASSALIYINGGHEPPVISGQDGVRTRLDPTGPAVGMLPGMQFRVARQSIEPGETLLIYTDGVTDARSAEAVPFTEQRLLALLAPALESAAATIERIQTAVSQHTDAATQFDDITVLAVHRSRAPADGGSLPDRA
ncbi:MAG: PP2C family protein-serine/threonine phosphatase [Rhodanobacteraceae bacterium]